MNFRAATFFLLSIATGSAAQLNPAADRAFQAYVASLEAKLESSRRIADSALGGFLIQPINGGSWAVSGGLMHHWRAAALVPGATPQSMLALLRDYGALARYYAPEVVSSRALSDDGERAVVAMRFRKQQIVTVVLDAEFETRSGLAAAGRGYSMSRSIHVWQVDHPDSPREHRRPEGTGDGFLWRLNSYWSFEQTGAGLLIECEAVSLTRDIPAGLGWLLMPIIETLPRASLEFTLKATRDALLSNAMRRQDVDRAN